LGTFLAISALQQWGRLLHRRSRFDLNRLGGAARDFETEKE
jgi:hypothetical protein